MPFMEMNICFGIWSHIAAALAILDIAMDFSVLYIGSFLLQLLMLPPSVSSVLLTLKQSLGNPSSFPPNFLFGTASSAYQTDLSWQNIYPQGMEEIVTYFKERYHNIPMIITENGYGDVNKADSTIEELLNDVKRVEYMAGHLDALSRAIRKGSEQM